MSVTIDLAPTRSTRPRRAVFSLFEGAKAQIRVRVRSRQLSVHRMRPGLAEARIVLVVVIRDEADRIPFFLAYYRRLHVDHFVIIDNGSTDDFDDLVRDARDVSVVRAAGSYRKARYGNDWVNRVLGQYCRHKWILYVDVDEFLVYDDSETRPLDVLADHLEARGARAVPARMLDMYSTRSVVDNHYERGQDPLEVCDLFDAVGYQSRYEEVSLTTWVKGGPRGRLFFDDVQAGPALNKLPLVRWSRWNLYLKSSHQAWPLRTNSDAVLSGFSAALLHQKFLATFTSKVEDPKHLDEHTSEYVAYQGGVLERSFVAAPTSRFRSSADLVGVGIITALDW